MSKEAMALWIIAQSWALRVSLVAGPVAACLSGTWWGLFLVPLPFASTHAGLFMMNVVLGDIFPKYGELYNEVLKDFLKQ